MTLTDADLAMFARHGIFPALLEQAQVERVSDREARERCGIVGSGDRAGIVFPYLSPITGHRLTARLRRDHPEIENGKIKNKYISAYGDRRHLFFPPGAGALLADPSTPIILVEAEKSSLAITAWSARTGTKILPVATGGVWGWRGRIGKKSVADGSTVDEMGALPDLACASQRKVFILFDSNSATNPLVQAARAALASQLRKLRADVRVLDLPAEDGVNGPDDLIALRGDDAMRAVLERAESGIAILNDTENFIRRFVIMTDAQVIGTALWIAHTHAFQSAIWTPYLAVTSAEKRCAKSRLLETVGYLVRSPWQTSSATAASLFREIDQKRPTLLLDEVDALFKGDPETAQMVRAVLNAGAHHKGVVSRCVGKGTEIMNKDFHAFCPKALAGIGTLPDTVADRSLPIRLRRKLPSQTVERLRETVIEPQAAPLRKRLSEWMTKHFTALKAMQPDLPEELNDRQQDGAECLLAIADTAGGSWPEKARRALVELYTGEAAEDQSAPTLLLSDIQHIFDETREEWLPSADIISRLIEIQTSPWAEWKGGKPLSTYGLAKLLKAFSIHPKLIRGEAGPSRGYERCSFEEEWQRHLPRLVVPAATMVKSNTVLVNAVPTTAVPSAPKNGPEALPPTFYPLQVLQPANDAGETRFSHPLQETSVTDAKSEESPVFMRVVTPVTGKNGENGSAAVEPRENYVEEWDL